MSTVSYNGYMGHPVYTLAETIKRFKDIGYDGVEIFAAAPHAYPKHFSKDERNSILNLIKNLDMEVSSICPGLGGSEGLNPASPNKKEREESIEYYKGCIDVANDLECKILLWVSGWQVYGISYNESWEMAKDALMECAKYAKDKGVQLAVEPTPSRFSNIVNSHEDALKMMEEIGLDNVGVMLDTYHQLQLEESGGPFFTSIDYIKTMGKKLLHVHFADLNRTAPGSFTDFKPFIEVLIEINYKGYIACEAFSKAHVGMIEYKNYQYLNDLMKQIARA